MSDADQARDANLLIFELHLVEILTRGVIPTIITTLQRSSPDRLRLEFDPQEIAGNLGGIRAAGRLQLRIQPVGPAIFPSSPRLDNRPDWARLGTADTPLRMPGPVLGRMVQ